MSTTDFNLDALLSDMAGGGDDVVGHILDEPAENVPASCLIGWKEPEYTGTIDYRIRQLSYSSLLNLHSCPRKFQLAKLRTTFKTEEAVKSTITFAFGHIVGQGLQDLLEGRTLDETIWRAFLGWHTDLMNVDEKAKKSFWTACIALQRFASMREGGFLDEYELVYFEGKPACELSFAVEFPDGFRLRGFVDAVLRNKITGAVLVLECKTTGFTTINPATYKNSSQAIGYSVVLDVLFPGLSSYEVLYLVYQTTTMEYHPIPFTKSYLQRALWIREMLLDIEIIKMYEDQGIYPQRGESCTAFFRDCEYLQTCGLSTEYLTKPCTPEQEDKTDYQVKLTVQDLIEAQLRTSEGDSDGNEQTEN